VRGRKTIEKEITVIFRIDYIATMQIENNNIVIALSNIMVLPATEVENPI